MALLSHDQHPLLRLEAVQALARVSHPGIDNRLMTLARNVSNPTDLRAEARKK
jgi:hypothetical protein